jgi:serine/threonine protein kinase/Flp pilus assembly protein TadD
MSGRTEPDRSELPLDVLDRIDRACDRFEAALRRGEEPDPEDFLGAVAPEFRPALLRDLRAAEADARRRRAGGPGPGPDPTRPPPDAGRDALLGLLAIQTGLADTTAVVAALGAWARDRARPVADLLAAAGALDAPRRALLEGLVDEHLRAHGGVERCLASLPVGDSTRERLGRLGDPLLDATLSLAGRPPGADDPPGPEGRAAAFAVGATSSGDQRFRVIRPHAKGGLGAVFVALDRELNREVALKEILGKHADDPVKRQRFLVEAEITGGLEHPGIVPVYGLGTYGDGRPYYAMRFIKGDSLKEAVEQFHADATWKADPGGRSLALRKLLRRFTDVCNAVGYAHSRGVLHRDIKPGNVIVGTYGETLVVDWGLAKPLGRVDPGADAGERALTPASAGGGETLPGSALGTPAYMSPEQAAGDLEALGPRSDVYSLGATLYCLLTGKAPFHGEVGEVLRQVEQGEFPPPRQVDPSIDRALEAVCLKAMALDPADRYPSPRALAEDVERWMADEPVSARREPFTERARRWVRRRRTAVTAATAVAVVGLAVAVGGGAWLERQRQARAARVDVALGGALLLEKEAEGAVDDPARWAAAREAAHQVEAMRPDARDAATRDRIDALVRAVTEEAAAAERDRAVQARLVDIRSAKADDPDGIATDGDYLAAFQEAGIDVGSLTPEGAAATIKARPSAVAAALTAALDDWASVRRLRHDRAGARRLSAVARAVDPDPWRDGLRQALEQADPQARQHALHALRGSAHPEALPAVSLELLGAALSGESDRAGAEEVFRAGRRLHPGDVWLNYGLAGALGALARREEAVRYYTAARALRPETAHALAHALEAKGEGDEAIAVFRDLARLRPKVPRHHICLAHVLRSRGLSREADEALDPAIATARAELRRKPDNAGAHINFGYALCEKGALNEAVAAYREAIRLEPDERDAHYGLGGALQAQGRLGEAAAAYREAIRLKPDDAEAHTNLGVALRAQGRLNEAFAAYREAIRLEPDLAEAHNNLGAALGAHGRLDDAVAALREAIRLKPDLAEAHANLGHALGAHGRLDDAVAALREAIRLKPGLAEAHANLGTALRAQGRLGDAVAALREAIRLKPGLAEAHCFLGAALEAQGRFAESLAEYQRGHELGSKQAGWPYPSAQWVERVRRLVGIEPKLPALLRGETQPANTAERLGLARVCHGKGLYAAAARSWADALAREPALADDLAAGYRYSAVCAAALAAGGKGRDEPPPDGPARARLRAQALGWLRADLAARAERLDAGPPAARARAVQSLRHWKADTDLAGLRDEAELAKLPEADREACRALWAEVDALLRRASGDVPRAAPPAGELPADPFAH